MQELTRLFPNFLIIDVASVIERVQNMVGQVTHAIEFVFLFTLLAGFAVMYAAIASTQDERIYEAAVFRTFGARKQQLARAWAVEFAVLGALAGLCGSGRQCAGSPDWQVRIAYCVFTQPMDRGVRRVGQHNWGDRIWFDWNTCNLVSTAVTGTEEIKQPVYS